jgi:hypothetical protein
MDELAHVTAGLHHWENGTFDLCIVNPPLVRVLGVIPLVVKGVQLPQMKVHTGPQARGEWALGYQFVRESGSDIFGYFVLARWACIPFALLATGIICIWGTALYSRSAGLFSACLWVICPNSLANGQMITADMGACAFALWACFLFWRWAQDPKWTSAIAAGVVLGLAQLCKGTLLIFGPTLIIAWLAFHRRNLCLRMLGLQGGQLLLAFIVCLFTINAGYSFERTGTLLGDYAFSSKMLTTEEKDGTRCNMFRGSWIGQFPMPLPYNYLEGIDDQRADFEAGLQSYLRGEWRATGWWYYYLYGLLIKTPIGILFLVSLVIASYTLVNDTKEYARDEVFLLLPALFLIAFVSSQTGFNHHLRYILPALPFIFVWLGRIVILKPRFLWQSLAGLGAVTAAWSSLSVYPHSMSYFNELVGGPMRGGEHLVDSNIDWGQDILYLKEWYENHPEARPFHVACWGWLDPNLAGIAYTIPPRATIHSEDRASGTGRSAIGPQPGWHAVSVNLLRGYRAFVPNGTGGFAAIDKADYAYFLRAAPIATAGYSIWIYYLSPEDCDKIRSRE